MKAPVNATENATVNPQDRRYRYYDFVMAAYVCVRI